MPGKKGERMIPRLSTSKKFHSVRELVFSLLEKDPNISKDEVDKIEWRTKDRIRTELKKNPNNFVPTAIFWKEFFLK